MSNYTPGPWILVPEGPNGSDKLIEWSAVTDVRVGRIATVHPVPDKLGSQEDNAQLIVGAPDLFKALETLLRETEPLPELLYKHNRRRSGRINDANRAARAAIARVTRQEVTA